MYMDKRTLMTIKKTVYRGYIHTCNIITVYTLIYLGLNIFLFGNIYRYKDNTHI